MRSLFKHIAWIVLLAGCDFSAGKNTNWFKYYESQHSSPYGTMIFKNELKNGFPNTDVTTIHTRTADFLDETYRYQTTYFQISDRSYMLDTATSTALLQYCFNGNDVFLATSSYPNLLLDPYHIDTKAEEVDSVQLGLAIGPDEKHYMVEPVDDYVTYFSKFPHEATVLGWVKVNGTIRANMISFGFAGTTGHMILHSDPQFFTNYHMLYGFDKDPGSYALDCKQFLRYDDEFIWDGQNTRQRHFSEPSEGDLRSTLRYILQSEALTIALILLLIVMVVGVMVNSKRITRAIPVYVRHKNSTVAFINTIAILFRNQKNFIDLARHRASFILDIIRTKYHLDTTNLNEEFNVQLAFKIGVDPSETRKLVQALSQTRSTQPMDQKQFILFNTTIEQHIQKLKLYE